LLLDSFHSVPETLGLLKYTFNTELDRGMTVIT